MVNTASSNRDALKARWLELDPGSATWPCEAAGAATILLKQPAKEGGFSEMKQSPFPPKPNGVLTSTASLDPSALQDLMEILPDLLKASAGVPLRFVIQISLGDGLALGAQMVDTVNKLLRVGMCSHQTA